MRQKTITCALGCFHCVLDDDGRLLKLRRATAGTVWDTVPASSWLFEAIAELFKKETPE